MPDYDFDIGIIGGGAAGLTVAAGSAQLGAKTLLIEKEKELGGDCLHFGCVPSKTLIRTAQVYHQARNFEKYGLPALKVPPVDFRRVADRIRGVIQTIQHHDSLERFCGLGAKVEIGTPEFRDDHEVVLNGRAYSAKTWVLATGSSPRTVPIEGLSETPYLTNKDIFSLDKLPESMICLGAGPISIEMAQAFSRLGTKIEVIQKGSQILAREDPDLATVAMAQLEAEGIKFHLNTDTLRVREIAGGRVEVTVSINGGPEKNLTAEKLLVAVGRAPNLSGLGLENAGVKYDGRGLAVDRRMRTNRKHIYGAGDVTGRYLFTHAAGYEGGIVVSNAIFRLPRKADYTNLPWCTYTEPELASIGLNESAAKAAGIGYDLYTEEFSGNDRALAEGETVGRVKLLLGEKDRPIGVQILGPSAGELISEWVAVINGRVKPTTLVGSIHPYPTLAEINKRVTSNYLGPKIFSEKVQKALKFFFSFKGRACELPEEPR